MHLKIQNQYWFEWGQVKQSGWPHIITNTDCKCKNQNLSAKFYKYKTTKGRNTNSNEWSASASAAAVVGRRAAPPSIGAANFGPSLFYKHHLANAKLQIINTKYQSKNTHAKNTNSNNYLLKDPC